MDIESYLQLGGVLILGTYKACVQGDNFIVYRIYAGREIEVRTVPTSRMKETFSEFLIMAEGSMVSEHA